MKTQPTKSDPDAHATLHQTGCATPVRVGVLSVLPAGNRHIPRLDGRFSLEWCGQASEVTGADLVIVVGSGVWVIETITVVSKYLRLPICAVLLDDDDAAVVHALDAGADDVMRWPVAPAELDARLAALHRRARRLRARRARCSSVAGD